MKISGYTTTTGTEKIDSMYENTKTTAVPPYYSSCPYRLPCGYCTRLGHQCPYGNGYDITWKITC